MSLKTHNFCFKMLSVADEDEIVRKTNLFFEKSGHMCIHNVSSVY